MFRYDVLAPALRVLRAETWLTVYRSLVVTLNIFLCFLPIVADPGFLELAAAAPVCQPSGKPSTRFPLEGPVEQEPRTSYLNIL